MNYKKLLKNVLLSAGTIVTASNTVFAVRDYDHFFCKQKILWKEATIASKNINNLDFILFSCCSILITLFLCLLYHILILVSCKMNKKELIFFY